MPHAGASESYAAVPLSTGSGTSRSALELVALAASPGFVATDYCLARPLLADRAVSSARTETFAAVLALRVALPDVPVLS